MVGGLADGCLGGREGGRSSIHWMGILANVIQLVARVLCFTKLRLLFVILTSDDILYFRSSC